METTQTQGTEQQVAATQTKTKAEVKKPVVTILSAIYGRGSETVDVTAALNGLANGGNNRKLTNKLIGGVDPCKNKIKSLKVCYSVDGVEQTPVEIMENEKITLDIPAPTPAPEAETATAETATAETATA